MLKLKLILAPKGQNEPKKGVSSSVLNSVVSGVSGSLLWERVHLYLEIRCLFVTDTDFLLIRGRDITLDISCLFRILLQMNRVETSGI